MRVQARAPAALPQRTASARARPSTRATARPATNASPAAVVSTTGTSNAGSRDREAPSMAKAPCLPRVITTAHAPRRARSIAALSASSWDRIGTPASRPASLSLATSTSTRGQSSSGRLQAGDGLRIVFRPWRCATSAARATVCMGVSSWSSKTSCSAMTVAAALMSAGASRALAPETTTIMFCPESSTTIKARPVDVPSSRRTPDTSTPSWEIACRNCSPYASAPTRPIRETCAPRRAAATAWFAPLPPGMAWSWLAMMVSPGRGSAFVRTTRSMLRLPTTTTSAHMGHLPLLRGRGRLSVRRRGRVSDGEFGSQQHPARRGVVIMDSLDKQLGGGCAHLVLGLAYGGQRWHDVGGKLDVVETHDRELGRYVQAMLGRRPDGADGHHVVVGKDGGRRIGQGQQPARRLIAALIAEIASDGQLLIERDIGFSQRPAISGAALGAGGHLRGSRDATDPAVVQVEQVACGQPTAALVVGENHVGLHTRHVAVDDDERDAACLQSPDVLRAHAGGDEDDSIHLLLRQDLGIRQFLLQVAVGIAENGAEA